MSIHDNHRQRLRQTYLDRGAEGLSDQQLLELYLFAAIPRKDVNPLACRLLQVFGSLDGVFRAEQSALEQVPGVGPQVACHLRLLMDLVRRCEASRLSSHRITDWQSAGEYLQPCFFGAVTEQVWLLCLDAGGRVLQTVQLGAGTATSAGIDPQAVLREAERCHAASLVLAHNHPGGNPQPSEEDLHTTAVLRRMLREAGVTLLDHLIFADGLFTSLRRFAPGVWEDAL